MSFSQFSKSNPGLGILGSSPFSNLIQDWKCLGYHHSEPILLKKQETQKERKVGSGRREEKKPYRVRWAREREWPLEIERTWQRVQTKELLAKHRPGTKDALEDPSPARAFLSPSSNVLLLCDDCSSALQQWGIVSHPFWKKEECAK
ncbi:hypothetical protein CEXT_518031 [Caerostris extrusa]|uniref:Uncharacterized protein n=1 Tax=Caerostris extrusa TaxID=172846 RepID=A0AAV4SE54_CAEEX|nr:hypothetical protein CEXT_518031 [Caerostris extrusa]